MPYAKTNVMKARGKNAAFAWKYQNIKRGKSKPRDNEDLDKMQEEMQNSINKTFMIFEKGSKLASSTVSSECGDIIRVEGRPDDKILPGPSPSGRQKYDFQSQLKLKQYKIPLGDLPKDAQYIEALTSLHQNFSLAQIAQLSFVINQIQLLDIDPSKKDAILKDIVGKKEDFSG
jgi:hypothetical protein